jgi:hypothetical protein
MAIPPDMLKQFAQPSDLTPEAALFERATTNANASLPEPERTDYKDGLDDDGWGYRYFDDGKVKIIVAPEGHRAGQILTGGPAYTSIMARKPVLVPPSMAGGMRNGFFDPTNAHLADPARAATEARGRDFLDQRQQAVPAIRAAQDAADNDRTNAYQKKIDPMSVDAALHAWRTRGGL